MIKSELQRKLGIVLSYVQMALSICIGLFYTPIMLEMLGKSEYGLYSTISSVISMLSILSLGFSSGYLKYYAIYKNKNDNESIWKLNGLYISLFTIIGVISLIIGLIISKNLGLVFDKGLSADEYATAEILTILLAINLSLSFPMSVFNTIITANEKFIVHKIVEMGKTVITPILTIIFLYIGYKSIGLVIVTIIVSLIVDVFNILYVLLKLKNKFILNNIEGKLFKSIFAYTFFIMINIIVKQINWNVAKIILGRFEGTEAVAIYSVAFSLYVYYETFSTSISGVCRTKVHLIVEQTNDNISLQREQLSKYFTDIGRLQFLILGLICTGLIIFGKTFIVDYWVGIDYQEAYLMTLLLVIPSSIPLIQNLGIDVQRALYKHKFRSIAYLFMSILNILLTIILCKKYGLIGATCGTALSILVVDGIVMNIYYHRKCNLNINYFWINILKSSLGVILPLLFGWFIIKKMEMYNIFNFILLILIYTCLYCISIYFFSLSKEEKIKIKKILTFKRIRK